MEEVEGRAGLEPRDLGVAERVVELEGFGRAIQMVDGAGDGLSMCQVGEAGEADAVILSHQVVVGPVLERQRQ